MIPEVIRCIKKLTTCGLLYGSIAGITNAQEQGKLSGMLSTWPSMIPSTVDTNRIMKLIRDGQKVEHTFPDSAISLFRQAEQEGQAALFNDGIVFALMNLGTIYIRQGDPGRSLAYYREALAYCKNTINYNNLSLLVYNNIAGTYSHMGAYREANQYYFYALHELMRRYSYVHPYTIGIYSNLAAIQIRLGQYSQALYYLNTAEKYARKNRQIKFLAAILNNRGDAYAAMQQPEQAIKYYTESLEHARAVNNPEIRQSIFNSLGGLLLQENKPREAIRYLTHASQIRDKKNPYHASIIPGYLLGAAYYQTGDYEKAKEHLLPALAEARKLGLRDRMPDAYKTLADVYDSTGDYRRAALFRQAYIQLNDSLMKRDRTQAINQLEIKYRTAQKDKEIAEKQLLINQQQSSIRHKNIWIGSITTGGVIITLLLAALYRNYRHKQRLQTNRIQMLEQQQEISRLKATIQGAEQERKRIAIDLHDGIGGLLAAAKMNFTAVKRQFPEIYAAHDFTDGLRLLKDASGELRETAHNLKPDGLLREGLIRAVHFFCTQIMKGHDIRVDIQVYGTIELSNAEFELSVFRIIQELVHNIIKHAMATEALVELSMHNHILNITIADNGAKLYSR